VLPFLAGVAAGDLDPADPGTRQQATVLEAAVRDDIRLGACLDDQTRILIAHARTSGRQVEINAEPEAAGLLPADLISRLLTAALEDAPPVRTVLSISGAPGEVSASLFVTPAPTGQELRSIADAAAAGVVDGSRFLLVRLTVTAEMSPQQGTVQQPARTVGSTR
jgi:hypothetical protein